MTKIRTGSRFPRGRRPGPWRSSASPSNLAGHPQHDNSRPAPRTSWARITFTGFAHGVRQAGRDPAGQADDVPRAERPQTSCCSAGRSSSRDDGRQSAALGRVLALVGVALLWASCWCSRSAEPHAGRDLLLTPTPAWRPRRPASHWTTRADICGAAGRRLGPDPGAIMSRP